LDSENIELSQKNSQNKEELKTLNQRLAEMLCQREEPGACTSEKWEQENASLKEELDHYKVQVRSPAIVIKCMSECSVYMYTCVPEESARPHYRWL
jgi:hypothetical protein